MLTRGLQFALDVGVLGRGLRVRVPPPVRVCALPEGELNNAIQQLPYVVLVQFAALALAGVYSFIWRYVGMAEVKAFLYAARLVGARASPSFACRCRTSSPRGACRCRSS
jgi:hypothetical protein